MTPRWALRGSAVAVDDRAARRNVWVGVSSGCLKWFEFSPLRSATARAQPTLLSPRMYLSISLKNSTPPQNHQRVVYHHLSNVKLMILWGT